MSKRRLYFAAVNNRYGDQAFLPYAAGLMWGYARQQPGITDDYEMCGMLFAKEPVNKAADRLVDPHILALSSYIWNHEWNKALAREVKRRWSSCAILVGGVQIPEESPRALEECKAFDFAIYGEGEGAFADFLREHEAITVWRQGTKPTYRNVGSLVWYSPTLSGEPKKIVVNPRRAETPMEDIPSPYLLGLFDDIIAANPQVRFQALQETNRGCPYSCLAGDTVVELQSTSEKFRLDEIEYGPPEKVCNESMHTHRFSACRRFISQGRRRCITLVIDNGMRLTLTPDHYVYVVNQKRGVVVPAGDLVVGQLVQTVDGKFRVQAIEDAGEQEVYDVHDHPGHVVFANGLIVHNCTFCAWGAASLTKVRQFPIERIIAEYEWFAHNKIELLYNADANMGILKRDIALTEELVKTKQLHGYPKRFRAAYAKNSNDTVFNISKTLADAGMLKATTLALQSEDDGVLVNIKRKNIKHDKFAELSRRYEEAGIATYVELIVGLPGETYESFIAGIDRVLDAGQHDSLSIYLCMMLANTEMDKPEYRAEHGLETVNMRALLYHGTPEPGVPEEIQETVVGTRAMPRARLTRAVLFSWMVQALHSLGLTQQFARWLCTTDYPYSRLYEALYWGSGDGTLLGRELRRLSEIWGGVVAGESWRTVDERFGEVMWPPEELLFLRLAVDSDRFYDELKLFMSGWEDRGFVDDCADLVEEQRALFIPPEPGKLVEYAREAVWYGRKGPGRKLRLRERSDAAQR